jgi:predicted metalloprotease with PDZ domain
VAAKPYLEALADEWGKYLARPGRNVTPLSELSFEAWIKLYKPADNHTNRTVSYYEKGKWAGLVLELLLREATAGRRGVPDLFKRLWRDFGKTGEGLTSADVRAAAEGVAGRGLRSYFERFIDGTDELPVPAFLRRAGIEVTRTPVWADEDDPTRARRQRGWAGLSFAPGAAERPTVRNVIPDSPAWRAGLTFGDEVVAVDDMRVTAATVSKRFADRQPGETVRVSFFRQDTLRAAEVVLAQNPEQKWDFALQIAAPLKARAVRRGWLGA